jgi:hypothetical protein
LFSVLEKVLRPKKPVHDFVFRRIIVKPRDPNAFWVYILSRKRIKQVAQKFPGKLVFQMMHYTRVVRHVVHKNQINVNE